MSMQDYPSSNYTVNAAKFLKLLSKAKQKEFRKILKDGDAEDVENFLIENIKDLPPIVQVHYASDAYTPDVADWEEGDFFVEFDEDTLFVKVPTESMKTLRKLKIEPTFSRWNVYM